MLLLSACTPASVGAGAPEGRSLDTAEFVAGAPDDSAPQEDEDAPLEYDHIAVLLVDAGGAYIPDGTKVDATLEVVEDHDGTLEDLDASPRTWSGPIGIEQHGSSSLGYPKIGYRFECRDDAGEDADCALAGMDDGSDWVLRAPYADKTLMREALSYALGRATAEASGRWEPDTRFVEVFLDRSYLGVYLLVERVSRDADRIAIPAFDEEDRAFIVKIDQHRGEGFDTAAGTPVDWSDPHASEVTPAQAEAIRGYFDDFEVAITAEGWEDAWGRWIDADAWVDHWLLNEIAHNIDAYRLSAYLWKAGDADGGLLYAGPLWDFDRAWGNCNYCYTWNTNGWIHDSLELCGYGYQFPFWWEHLRTDAAFLSRTDARWQELRAGPLSDDAVDALIDGFVDRVAEAEARDAARWGNVGDWVDPNYWYGATWEEEVEWLRDWAHERAAWMDANVPG